MYISPTGRVRGEIHIHITYLPDLILPLVDACYCTVFAEKLSVHEGR